MVCMFFIGHYLYVDAKQKVEETLPKAAFVSTVYHHGTYDCKFSFWYNMYHQKVIDHNDAQLRVSYRSRKYGIESDTYLWSDAKTTNIKWKQAIIQLPRCPRLFNVSLGNVCIMHCLYIFLFKYI